MRSIKLGLAIVVFLLVSTGVAQACTCAPPPSPAQALSQSDAVFSGRVIKIKRVKSKDALADLWGVEVVFAVNTSWKGGRQKTVSVFTASQSAACGYNFSTGMTYLVYADASQGKLATSLCSRTSRLKDAREDLKELGTGKVVRRT